MTDDLWPRAGLPGTTNGGWRPPVGPATQGPKPLDLVADPAALAEILEELGGLGYRDGDGILGSGYQADVYGLVGPEGELLALRVDRHKGGSFQDLRLEDLEGPMLVKVHRVGIVSGFRYQVLDRISGTSLRHLFSCGQPLDPGDLRQLLLRSAETLEQLGTRSLMHGDVSDENGIAVGERGSLDFRLLDYGLTCRLDQTTGVGSDTANPRFAPPEHFYGACSKAWDAWSFGMLALQAALGRHPLEGGSGGIAPAVLQGLHRDDFEEVDDPSLRRLIAGLLEPRIDKRFGSRQIRSWLNHEPLPEPTRPADASPVDGSGSPSFPIERDLVFAGRRFSIHDPRNLADALGLNWSETELMLGSTAGRSELLAWLAGFNDPVLLAAAERAGDPRENLDEVIVDVIARLNAIPGARGLGSRWVHGYRITPASISQLATASLASAAELHAADQTAAGLGPEASPELRACTSLVEGRLAHLAERSPRSAWLRRLTKEFNAGCTYLDGQTDALDPVAEPWERMLWRIELLAGLTSIASLEDLRAQAWRATRKRRDLEGHLDGGANQLIVAIVQSSRTPRQQELPDPEQPLGWRWRRRRGQPEPSSTSANDEVTSQGIAPEEVRAGQIGA